MRDPERIPIIMDLAQTLWAKYPDMRFNQFISSLQWEYAERKGAYIEDLYRKEERKVFTTYMLHKEVDLFNVEDDDFIKYLQQKLEEEF